MVTTKQKRNLLFIFIIIFSLLALQGCVTLRGSFEKAKKIDNIQAYEEFVRIYPESPLVQQAKERIAELMKFSKALSEAKIVRVLIATNAPSVTLARPWSTQWSYRKWIHFPTSGRLILHDMFSKIASWTLEAGGYKVVGQEADEFDITFRFGCDRIVVYTPDLFRFGPNKWQLCGELQVQLPGQTEVIVRHVVGPLADAGSVGRLVVPWWLFFGELTSHNFLFQNVYDSGKPIVPLWPEPRQLMLVQDILLILAELGNADRLMKIANSPYYVRSVPSEQSRLALAWQKSIEAIAREILESTTTTQGWWLVSAALSFP